MRHLLLTLICSAYFAALSVGAQAVPAPLQKVTLSGFLGLNTADGDLNVDPRFMRKAHNVDFSRYGLNVIGARRGSSVRMARAGIDSLTGAGAFNRLDGQRQLIFAQDSSTVGYGSLYTTRIGSDSIRNATDTSNRPIKLVTYWSPQAPTTFTNYRDAVVASNGLQKMVVYDGRVTRTLPIAAPGEILCTPEFGTTTGTRSLTGQYRYLVTVFENFAENPNKTDSFMLSGYMSDLVPVSNGSVRITNIQYPNRDSLGYFGSGPCDVLVWRTKVNPGEIDIYDTLWPLPHLYTLSDSTTTLTIVDSATDAQLTDTLYMTATKTKTRHSIGGNVFAFGFLTPAGKTNSSKLPTSTGGTYTHRYGAPQFISASYVTDSGNAITKGLVTGNQNVIWSTSYTCTFVDTSGRFVNESDTANSLELKETWGSNRGVGKIRLSLPRVPVGQSGLLVRLYRQHSFLASAYVRRIKRIVFNPQTQKTDTLYEEVTTIGDKTSSRYVVPIVKTGFRLVATISADSLYFTDSLKWGDSLQFADRFTSSTPGNLANVQTINGRLYGTNGVRLYASSDETPGFFGVFDFNDFSSDRNDAIQAFWATRDGIRVFLTNSNHLVPNGDGAPVKIGSFGSTPRSHAEGNGGHFYMTFGGQVVFEQDGTSLERTFTSAVVSEQLRNFANLSADIKSKAVGFYLPEEEKYLLNIDYGSVDTTFCWDVRAGTWSTWDLSIGHATLFDTGAVGTGIPSRTMYYVPRGTASIYRYPDTTTVPDLIDFETVPLLREPFSKSQITSLALWGRSPGGGIGLTMYFYNEERAFIGTVATPLLPTFNRYKRLGVAESKPAMNHTIRFVWTGSSSGTYVDGLEIEYKASASGVAR